MTDAAIIICSRRDSKRIPNKAFKKIRGISAIEHILGRINNCGLPIVLAIPEIDYPHYIHLQEKYSFKFYLGNPDSPLHRTANALASLGTIPKYCIRITHDDLFIDKQTMLDLLGFVDKKDAGYGISPSIMEGAGVEVIHSANLMYAAESIIEPVEHISYFVKGEGLPNPKISIIEPRQSIARKYRLCLDYPEDAVVLEAILSEIGNYATVDTICNYIDSHHSLLRYNRLPLVSIYTCAYQASRWVRETVDSVVEAMDGTESEYVFIDDSSVDNTISCALRGLMGIEKSRCKIIVNDENLGLASSSNVALDNCRGKYVMRVDADDILKPYAIKKLLALGNGANSFVYSAYDEIGEDGKTLKHNFPPQTNHHVGCALMERNLLNHFRFKEGLRNWDGKDLYNRAIAASRQVSYVQNEPLWFYRRHENSLSASNSEQRALDKEAIER